MKLTLAHNGTKKHCHRRVAEHELNRASQQQQPKKIEKQRDFKAPQALSGDTELTARAANVLNSVAKVQNSGNALDAAKISK